LSYEKTQDLLQKPTPQKTNQPSPFQLKKKYQILEAPARLNSRLKRKRKSIPRPAVLKIGTSKKDSMCILNYYVHIMIDY